MKKHLAIVSSIFVLALCFMVMLWNSLGIQPQKVATKEGQKAYPLKMSFYKMENGEFRLQEDRGADLFKGKALIVNFWASWCTSCRMEAQVIENYWRQSQDDVIVLGVAIQDDLESTLSVAKELKKTYIIGFDSQGDAAIDFGVTGVPETYFIDKKGLIVHKETGPLSAEIMDRYASLLREG